jgi:hypothetical protein
MTHHWGGTARPHLTARPRLTRLLRLGGAGEGEGRDGGEDQAFHAAVP